MLSDARRPNYKLRQRSILDTQYPNTPSGDNVFDSTFPDSNILEKIWTHFYYGNVFHMKRKHWTVIQVHITCRTVTFVALVLRLSFPFLHIKWFCFMYRALSSIYAHAESRRQISQDYVFHTPLNKVEGLCCFSYVFLFVFVNIFLFFSFIRRWLLIGYFSFVVSYHPFIISM